MFAFSLSPGRQNLLESGHYKTLALCQLLSYCHSTPNPPSMLCPVMLGQRPHFSCVSSSLLGSTKRRH